MIGDTLKSFLKGQRVRLTKLAMERFIKAPSNKTGMGTVTQDTIDSHYVRVRQDGIQRSSLYAVAFWDSADSACPLCGHSAP